MLTWLGVNTDPGHFSDDVNWYNYSTGAPTAVPTTNDDLYFVGLPSMTAPPMPGSPPPPMLPWNANPDSNATIPTSLLTLSSVHLLNGNSSDNQSLGTLDLQSGKIGQLAASDGISDLRITTYLAFFGGTLNNTTNTGIVHITGNGSTAADANLQPLTTSSGICYPVRVDSTRAIGALS